MRRAWLLALTLTLNVAGSESRGGVASLYKEVGCHAWRDTVEVSRKGGGGGGATLAVS